jgi:NAD(P)-dependent dehydrogenase (short-subunit alcohol dehydrogenase family)
MTEIRFDDRVAIVTGAGRGMGREHAKLLASRGARVVVNDVTKADSDAVVAEITAAGGTAIADNHDVAKEGAQLVAAAIEAFGRLDIVINNAGIVRFGNFGEQDPDEFWKVFDVSFRGTLEVTRAAWPHLIKSGAGRVINIASSAKLSEPGISAYSAAKGAIWALSNTLADEGAKHGIRVHSIVPNAWTPMVESSVWPKEVEATFRGEFHPHRVATFVAWLADPENKHTSAQTKTFRVGGGHAGRTVYATLPAVKATEDTPEGWEAVADQLVQDSDDLKHFWDEGTFFANELFTADPTLKDRIGDESPTGGAGEVANSR